MKRNLLGYTAAGAIALAAAGCKKSEPPAPPPAAQKAATAAPAPADDEITPMQLVFFKALPAKFESPTNPITSAKVDLGRALYYDTRLSKNHDLSCNSCHDLAKFGVDGEKTSPGHKGQRGGRNSPTVLNAAGNVAQFWDGRAADVEAQAKGPILNPIEMAMPSDKKVVEVLASIPGYAPLFKAAFPDDKDPITYDNLAKAIGAFERQITTPARFDKLLGGDKAALTSDEKRGLKKFVEVGCTTCHNGANVGGQLYQKLGLVVPWPDQKDLGRFEVTKQEGDKLSFRVPSLRNVEKTAPYFHDGSVADLPAAVRLMAKHQLGKDLTDADVASIVAFLKTLTGDVDAKYVAKPELPPSGPKTPKPDPS